MRLISFRQTSRVTSITALCLLAFGTLGCASINRAPNSYDRAGEQVRLSMLTLDDLQGYAKKHLRAEAREDFNDCWHAAYDIDVEAVAGEAIGDTEFAESAAAFASGVVGVAIDLVAKELEKDAERYQMQYRGVHYNDRFWEEVDSKATPAFRGFDVVRWTSRFPESEGVPASRFVCAMVPSRFDPRVFVLRPLYLEVNGTKAKIPKVTDKDTFSAEFDIQLVAAIVSAGNLKESILATTKWKVGGLDLDDDIRFRTFHIEGTTIYDDQYTAGWFLGVPLPESSGVPKKEGGPFRLVVAVTETADSKAPEYLEKAAGYLRENKKDIQTSVGSFVQPN